MNRFIDQRAEQIYRWGDAPGVRPHTARQAHRTLRLLIAAHSWQDVALGIGRVARFGEAPERFGIPLEGKWHLTFAWAPQFGAVEISLERR